MTKPDKPSILISMPCYGSVMDAYTAGGIFHLGQQLMERGIKPGLYIVMNESFIPSARNRIAAEFLLTDFTHLMCIDSDIGFVPDDVIRLLEKNEDFVTAEYFTKSEKSRSTVKYSSSGEVKAVGMGFTLLTKNVFQKMVPSVEVLKAPDNWGMPQYHNFFSPIVVDNVLLAEDISFCKRWGDVGGTIYIDDKIKLSHFGRHAYKRP